MSHPQYPQSQPSAPRGPQYGQPQYGQTGPQPRQTGPQMRQAPPQPGPAFAPGQPKGSDPWWKKRAVIGAGAGLLGIIIGAAAGGGGSTTAAPAGATVTATAMSTATVTSQGEAGATVTQVQTVTKTVSQEKTVTVTQKPDAAPAAMDGDGMYEVGKDVAPGTYKATGEWCYWARLSSADGDFESIIANGNGPSIVTISPDDKYFETRGCTWVKR